MIFEVNLREKGLLLLYTFTFPKFNSATFPKFNSAEGSPRSSLSTYCVPQISALLCTLLIRLFHTKHYSTQVWIEQQ